MKIDRGRNGTRYLLLGVLLVAVVGLAGCGTYFDPEKAEQRQRKKERSNGYRKDTSGWEKWKEWERVNYRDWFRRMTSD